MDYQINGKTFHVIDTLDKITTKDSFTHQDNKLGAGAGAWEWHIGSKNDIAKYNFFGGSGFDVNCFLKKDDLLWLMKELQSEYYNPSQNYREILHFQQIYQGRLNEIKALPPFSFFKFREHDRRDPLDNRLYAKRPGTVADGDKVYGLIRKLALPDITFTSIIKLQALDGEILFYFKIFPEFSIYDFDSIQSVSQAAAIESSLTIPKTEKDQLIKSRIGQGKFRNGVLLDCNFCPVTLINDTRLLIASHIKPWSISTNAERLDPKNGILLTPTIDKLFDAGFISFSDNCELIVSAWLSQDTLQKLHLTNGVTYPLFPVIGREPYLHYHRESVFKS
jgi:putative restriction endonuclease